jgi:hypothetical protein
LDTGVTQDVVNGDDMKIEVWDRPAPEELQAISSSTRDPCSCSSILRSSAPSNALALVVLRV